jgi:hypothetical protein
MERTAAVLPESVTDEPAGLLIIATVSPLTPASR